MSYELGREEVLTVTRKVLLLIVPTGFISTNSNSMWFYGHILRRNDDFGFLGFRLQQLDLDTEFMFDERGIFFSMNMFEM